jgi:hypothetical protein
MSGGGNVFDEDVVILTDSQRSLIKESLQFTRAKFVDYRGYPDEAYRRERIAQVNETIKALRKTK